MNVSAAEQNKKHAIALVDRVQQYINKGYTPPGETSKSGQLSAIAAAAEAMGVKRNTLVSQINRARRDYGLVLTPLEPDIADTVIPERNEIETQRLKDKISYQSRRISEMARQLIEAEDLRTLLTGVRGQLSEPKEWKTARAKVKPGNQGTPIALWSDWHVGETVVSEQVAGINEFNLEVAEARVKQLVERIIMLCFDYTVNPKYHELVVALDGDMITGMIHDLDVTNAGSVPEQIVACFMFLADAIETLSKHFPRIRVKCVVGNHGRSTFKPRPKNKVRDNFEWAVYSLLVPAFRDNDKVHVEVAEDTELMFEVEGYRFCLMHGDATGARGGDGMIGAAGPIIRGEKKVADVASIIDEPYDYALIGHYHQMFITDRLVANPTLKGYDEFAKNTLRARPEPPSQMLLFVHEDFGIVDYRRIFLD